jgi:CBS domain containing-hemolysin-like protein
MQRAVQHLNANLATAQLGITMASLGLGWIGEPALAALLEPALSFLPPNWGWVTSHVLASIIAFSVITALHIVLGEQAPKVLALQRAEQVARFVAVPMELCGRVFRPAIVALNGASAFVLRLVGLPPAMEHERVHSVEELRYLVSASRHAGVLDDVEGRMVDRVMDFGETRVDTLMVPRTQMVAVNVATPLDQATTRMAQAGYTRLPVYEGTIDNVVGLVTLRDLVRARLEGQSDAAPVRTLMRAPVILPEGASAEAALSEMQRRRTQMAIVIDEHGGTAGLVTLEDVLEQIVGEVQDEAEEPYQAIRPQTDGTIVIDGLLSVDDFSEHLGLTLPEQANYNTVGGLVMAHLGRVPEVGDAVVLASCRL